MEKMNSGGKVRGRGRAKGASGVGKHTADRIGKTLSHRQKFSGLEVTAEKNRNARLKGGRAEHIYRDLRLGVYWGNKWEISHPCSSHEKKKKTKKKAGRPGREDIGGATAEVLVGGFVWGLWWFGGGWFLVCCGGGGGGGGEGVWGFFFWVGVGVCYFVWVEKNRPGGKGAKARPTASRCVTGRLPSEASKYGNCKQGSGAPSGARPLSSQKSRTGNV